MLTYRAVTQALSRQNVGIRALCTSFHDDSHLSSVAKTCIKVEKKYGLSNPSKLPIVLSRGYGARVWDVEGREYLDFTGQSALNFGHSHPRLVTALASQAAMLSQVHLTSYDNKCGTLQNKICTLFGFEKCLPLSATSDASVALVMLARRWARKVKKIPESKATILLVGNGCMSHYLIGSLESSTKNIKSRKSGLRHIPFDNIEELKQALLNQKVAAVIIPPIQDVDLHIPERGYFQKMLKLCQQHNVLLAADETSTGLGRTGRLLGVEHGGIKPDLVVIGNSLGGGLHPISALMGRSDAIDLLQPGDMGVISTGSPLSFSIAMEALDIIIDEKLIDKAESHGKQFRESLANIDVDWIVRGQGLLNSVELTQENAKNSSAARIMFQMARHGVLATLKNDSIIHLTPPLTVSSWEIEQALLVIRKAVRNVFEDDTNDKSCHERDGKESLAIK